MEVSSVEIKEVEEEEEDQATTAAEINQATMEGVVEEEVGRVTSLVA